MSLSAATRSLCVALVMVAFAAERSAAQSQKPKTTDERSIPFLVARDEAQQRADQLRNVMNQQMAAYVAARKALHDAQGIDSKVPRDEVPALQQQFAEASQNITQATLDLANAENERRRTSVEAQTHGVPPQPESTEQDGPLGPSGPINHDIHGGPLFQQLRDVMEPTMKADGAAGTMFYDGAAMPPELLEQSLATQREYARAEAERQRLERERIAVEQRQRAAEEAARRRAAAAAAAEAKRQREIEDITAKINAHVDAAASVNVNDPAAIKRYNDLSDYYLREYKRLTGKDHTYHYQRVK